MGDPCYTGESTHQCDGCCNLVSGAVDMVVRPCVIHAIARGSTHHFDECCNVASA